MVSGRNGFRGSWFGCFPSKRGACVEKQASQVAQTVESAAMQEIQVQSLGPALPPEKGMATHSSILAWEIPWTEEPGGLQSAGSQKSQM